MQLQQGSQAAADHHREAAGPPRRVVAHACLRSRVLAGPDRTSAGQRSAGSRVRWIRGETGAAGAGGDENDAGRARRDQEADRQQDGRLPMTPLLQTAGWTLIHFVWQGAAIALVIAAALRLLRDRSADARYLIACTGLVLMIAAPAATARLIWTAAVSPLEIRAETMALHAPDATEDAVHGHRVIAPTAQLVDLFQSPADPAASDIRITFDRFPPAIAIVWLAGVTLLLVRMAGGWWQVRRLHRLAVATSSCRWQSTCRRIAYRLGLPAAAHVVESTLVDVPTVVGWLRPAILLPVAALASLSPSQVEAIIAHELAHIRRHDYAVNLLQTLVETLLFYHPAVWWLSNRIRTEREHCCDDVAIAICGDPVGYAQALAELEALRTTSAAMALAATGGSLSNRVRRILRMPATDEPRSASWPATLAVTVIFTAGAGGVQQLPRAITDSGGIVPAAVTTNG